MKIIMVRDSVLLLNTEVNCHDTLEYNSLNSGKNFRFLEESECDLVEALESGIHQRSRLTKIAFSLL